ncbi:peroxiredoxin-like family protein [Pseudonocardia spinosispora]|uniref:peroxiredoxin-like family protein n=1 Tax=Pseudonocardia spinosispora TaxID=103441 RepID=UPI000420340F|nr:peroxiredoxin-like family protein [Pseudonocardia spinosispora]
MTAGTEPTSLAEQVAAMEAQLGPALPAEALAAFDENRALLTRGGVPAGVSKPGSPLPSADLLDVHGAPTTVAETAGGRPSVLVFYRGAWCPYCNVALRAYQQELVPELDRLGITLIAVSPQKPDGSLTVAESNELSFAVLSDPGNQLGAGLGILNAPTPDAKAAQEGLGMNLAEVNADGTWTLPMPTVVLVDAEGTIRWIDVHPDYGTRTEPADILQAIRTTTV